MSNQDRVNFVWAETALTTIPPVPVSEVAYRDTTQTPEQMEVGQKYDTIYNSARHNQLLFLITSVAKTLCENGIMPFLAGQAYAQYARCIFTDGLLYKASRAILANEQPYPTPGDASGVWTVETDEHLVPDSRHVIAGTGLTGGGPLSADVTLAAKLTDSVSLADSTTAASAKAVKAVYDILEAFRLSMIGVPRYWRSTTLPVGHVWANGDLALFADWPELKKIYDAGGFSGMVLPYNADSATIAANLGKFRPNAANPTGLYVPNLSEQFFRAWTGGAGSAGGYNMPGVPDIIGNYAPMAPTTQNAWQYTGVLPGVNLSGAFSLGGEGEKKPIAQLTQNAVWEDQTWNLLFRASKSNPRYGASDTVMPASVNVPVMLYLGRSA